MPTLSAQILPHSAPVPPLHGCPDPVDWQQCLEVFKRHPDLQQELNRHLAAIAGLLQQATAALAPSVMASSPTDNAAGSPAPAQCRHTADSLTREHLPDPYLANIDLTQLRPSPRRVRIRNTQRIARLASLLKQHGQVGAILARPVDDGAFEIVDGHAVIEAARQLGWTTVRVLIEERSDEAAWHASLLVNTCQDGLTDYERARLCSQLRARGLADSQAALADMLGCSQPTVSNFQAMLALPAPVRNVLEEHPAKLSAKTVRALCRILPDEATRVPLLVEAMEAIEGEMTPERLKRWLHDRDEQRAPGAAQEESHPARDRSPFSVRLRRSLREFVIRLENAHLDLDMAAQMALATLHRNAEQLWTVGHREDLSLWEEEALQRRLMHPPGQGTGGITR